MSAEPITIDLRETAERLRKEIAERQQKLEVVEEWMTQELKRRSTEPESPKSLGGKRAIFAPKGTISGSKGAEQYLRQVGHVARFRDIHAGAISLGANISQGALHAIMSKLVRAGRIFYKDRQKGYYGLLEWKSK